MVKPSQAKLVKDKPTSKFEGAAFNKYVQLKKTKATGMGNQHDEAILIALTTTPPLLVRPGWWVRWVG